MSDVIPFTKTEDSKDAFQIILDAVQLLVIKACYANHLSKAQHAVEYADLSFKFSRSPDIPPGDFSLVRGPWSNS